MGRTLSGVIEARFAETDKPNIPINRWLTSTHYDFTDRHNGFYDDLNAASSFLRPGDEVSALTLDIVRKDAGEPPYGYGDWAKEDPRLGIRYVLAETYLDVLCKWVLDKREGRALHSRELLAIGTKFLMNRARPNRNGTELRLVYWFDDTPYEDVEQVLRDREIGGSLA